MKAGFNMLLWTPFVTDEHFYLFEKLKAAGYDGVELEVFEGDPAHYRRVAQALKDNGLQSTAGWDIVLGEVGGRGETLVALSGRQPAYDHTLAADGPGE